MLTFQPIEMLQLFNQIPQVFGQLGVHLFLLLSELEAILAIVFVVAVADEVQLVFYEVDAFQVLVKLFYLIKVHIMLFH